MSEETLQACEAAVLAETGEAVEPGSADGPVVVSVPFHVRVRLSMV